jgi:hypothetical protein
VRWLLVDRTMHSMAACCWAVSWLSCEALELLSQAESCCGLQEFILTTIPQVMYNPLNCRKCS